MSFALMFSNGLFSTPPSEVTYGVAGYLASLGQVSALAVITAGTAGNVAGTTLLFSLALYWGEPPVRWIFQYNPSLGEGMLIALQRLFARHGPVLVCLVRCLPTVRSVISVPAGIARMPLGRFLAYTTLGCTLWAALWVAIGLTFGEQVHAIVDGAKLYTALLTILIVVLSLFWVKRRVSEYIALFEVEDRVTPNAAHQESEISSGQSDSES